MSAASIKMDELLVSWLGRDDVYESVLEWIETYARNNAGSSSAASTTTTSTTEASTAIDSLEQQVHDLTLQDSTSPNNDTEKKHDDIGDTESETTADEQNHNRGTTIPPFYPVGKQYPRCRRQRNRSNITETTNTSTGTGTKNNKASSSNNNSSRLLIQYDTWDPPAEEENPVNNENLINNSNNNKPGTDVASIKRTSFSSPGNSSALVLDIKNSHTLDDEDDDDDEDIGESGGSRTRQHQQPLSLLSQQQKQQQQGNQQQYTCARDCAQAIYNEILGNENGMALDDTSYNNNMPVNYLAVDQFTRITKEVCRFPSYFNVPLYSRILELWNASHPVPPSKHQSDIDNNDNVPDDSSYSGSPNDNAVDVITMEMLEWFFRNEMEPYDSYDRFFRLIRQPDNNNFIVRDDFLPFIKALLADHPGLEFLSSHAEFQEKYAVTVITRIFYSVDRCHSGRITARQVRRSDLLETFVQVDEEEDINKVTRYFSYEHFYVLYCRFWELDHDRDYRITREDLLKYGDHSLSHMIVERIFDAAPRPFEQQQRQLLEQKQTASSASGGVSSEIVTATTNNNKLNSREYLSYEDFIYFMLSEEDKSNEVAVRYWFACVDVDGDSKLNNMEMRSFYAVQLHRMQCMGHEIVPFDDMLCQMMDMIKPANTEYLVVEDFLQPECCQVSGALFDALFNLNKYLLFEQRDPFVERQKREDEFECDWDRFACIDYNRLAMEEEAREEEAMEIDWVTVDDEEEDDDQGGGGVQASSANQADGAFSHQQQKQALVQQPGGEGGRNESPF